MLFGGFPLQMQEAEAGSLVGSVRIHIMCTTTLCCITMEKQKCLRTNFVFDHGIVMLVHRFKPEYTEEEPANLQADHVKD